MRRLSLLLSILLVSCTVSDATERGPAHDQVVPGVEVLAADPPGIIRGKRIGLITNHSAFDRALTSTIDVLAGMDDVELVALFAPEHGIRADMSGYLDSSTDEQTGLPVHSLYGRETRKPTPEMLDGVEALVFDIQDVGARQYTYVSTMALSMEAAREADIPIVILDRPNPIGGVIVEGNVLDTTFASFVGMYPIASRHGMTVVSLP